MDFSSKQQMFPKPRSLTRLYYGTCAMCTINVIVRCGPRPLLSEFLRKHFLRYIYIFLQNYFLEPKRLDLHIGLKRAPVRKGLFSALFGRCQGEIYEIPVGFMDLSRGGGLLPSWL